MNTMSQAADLLQLWNRFAAQHVTLGGGCSCGAVGVSVSLEDFERDIADYLQAEAQRLRALDAYAFVYASLKANTVNGNEKWRPVRDILERLATVNAEDAVAAWLLPRLARTLESFAKLHGPVAAVTTGM
jgi:hypothetical protein